MFGKWFGKEEQKARAVTHPKDLQVGDMLQMLDSFSLPVQLKNQTLTVKAVNSYQFKHEQEYELVLQNSDGVTLYLSVENDDGEEYANFSIKIERDQVDTLFTLDQFALIFDSDEWVSIERKGDLDDAERWLADHYSQKTAPERGYFYQGDYRHKVMSKYVEDGGEPFEYIGLYSDDDNHGVDIEIWEDGETEVFLTICRPLSDITEMYAKS